MPWRGPVAGSVDLEDAFPSLGWALADWFDEVFWWMPCTDEQVRKIVHFYRIDPESGRRVVRRGQFMGPKGTGKSPEAAKISIGELCGDVVFDGWDANGDPVGRPWSKPTPLIQIAAVSLDQTDNTYGALQELLGEHDAQAADLLGLDCGDTRTIRRSNHRARIDKVTASAGAREGQPVIFAVLDETHLWTPTNGGRGLARTIRRNVGKMGGSSLETTNAYDPTIESVAQGTDDATKTKPDGIYQWKPTAPHVEKLTNKRAVKSALKRVYIDTPWVDLDRLMQEMDDPETTEADNRRFYLNEVYAGAETAWDAESYKALEVKDIEPVGKRDKIAIGFDGSRFNDATALIGVRLVDRYEFVIATWENDGDDDDWEVPESEVDDAWQMAHDLYKPVRSYCDPPYWRDAVDRWCGKYDQVKKFETNQAKQMGYAVRSFDELVRNGAMCHSGEEVLVRHTLNSQKRQLTIRDAEGRFLWVIEKKAPKSPLKIDARVAGILAQQAAGDAIALGHLKKTTRQSVFV